MTDLEKRLEEIEKRAEAFVIHGTTDCSEMDCDGRVALFTKKQSCLKCRTQDPVPTSDKSDVPKLIEALRLAVEQRNEWLRASHDGDEIHRAEMDAELAQLLE
jgi:hypothetical protein